MKTIKTTAVAAILLVTATIVPAFADEQAERLAVARSYLEHSRADMDIGKIADASINQMLAQISKQRPNMTEEKKTRLRAIARPIFLNVMEKSLQGLDQTLAKVFTLEELKALNEFYVSPVGRSVMRKMPQYSAAIIPSIQRGIQSAIPELIKRFKEEGVDIQ